MLLRLTLSAILLGPLLLGGCGGTQPVAETSPAPELTPEPTSASTSASTAAAAGPTLEAFPLEQLDVAGCSLTLWPVGADPRQDGIYLFSGLKPGSTRLKINGEITSFSQTAGPEEAFLGDRTFTSADGTLTVEISVTETGQGGDPEVTGVTGTIKVIQDGQETTVEADGNSGC